MSAEYRFQFNEEHLLVTLARYRKQLRWFAWYQSLKVVLALPMGILAGIAFYAGALTAGAVLLAIIILLFVSPRIDAWIVRRRFRKSPFHDAQLVMRLSPQGLDVVGSDVNTHHGWSLFTKCRRYTDGLLLFQGPHLFYWMPNGAATSPSATAEAETLAKEHVRDYRDLQEVTSVSLIWKQSSVAARSALIAAGVSLGTLVGQLAGACLSERGVCTFNNPTLWVYWAATFFGAWIVLALAMWALDRHRRNHPGHERW